MPTAVPKAPRQQLFQIMFLPGLPVCGHDCHLANRAILLCQHVLNVPMLYCYDAWVLSDAVRQWHTTVLSGCKSLLVMPMSVPTTCDYSFSFGCQQAAAWMEDCTMEWWGIVRFTWLAFLFIRFVLCNSKVRAGSSTRVHLQRISSQPHTTHSGGVQSGICFTYKLKNTKTWFATSSPLAVAVSRSISRKCQAHITPINLCPLSYNAAHRMMDRGESRKEVRGRGGQKAGSQNIWTYLYLPQLSKKAYSAWRWPLTPLPIG